MRCRWRDFLASSPEYFRVLAYYLTAFMPVKQGVDTDEFGEFVEWLEENPEDAEIDVTASASYTGTVGRSTAEIESVQLGGDEIEHVIPDYDYGAWAAVEEEVGYVCPIPSIKNRLRT